MADNTEAGSEPQDITFKVKSGADHNHTITMSDAATVRELKTKLAGEEFENIAAERQRLIYSGRVMKDDSTLASYKIKANNIIHLVKSAASNPGQPAATSNPTSTTQTIPQNMASGTANNPLAGLTGARYAGHGINMPGMDMFGPDGGMGPPIDEERLSSMMSDPNVQQSMNEALNNPDFVNMLIESNPALRNMPNARDLITSPMMRSMLSNPEMMRQVMQLQRSMGGGGGGGGAFPAPGATDTADGAMGEGNTQPPPNPFGAFNPFLAGAGGGGEGAGGLPNLSQMMQQMSATGINPFAPFGQPGQADGAGAGAGAGAQTGSTGAAGQEGATQNTQSQSAANPFAALFPPAGGNQTNPFGMTPEMMQQMMQMMGGGGGAPAGPPDNRPPEERYEDQLRQLNDMGFHDFDRNVAALRRSGGSVQGAVEYLLSG